MSLIMTWFLSEIRTYHLHDNEQMRHVLSNSHELMQDLLHEEYNSNDDENEYKYDDEGHDNIVLCLQVAQLIIIPSFATLQKLKFINCNQ